MRLRRIRLLRLVPVLVLTSGAAAFVTPAAAQVQADTAAPAVTPAPDSAAATPAVP